MADEPLAACPRCQAKPRRLITGGAGILFKGSGFYQTDYRSSAYKEAAKKDRSDSTTSPSKPESKA